jgi:hypothetical protein
VLNLVEYSFEIELIGEIATIVKLCDAGSKEPCGRLTAGQVARSGASHD